MLVGAMHIGHNGGRIDQDDEVLCEEAERIDLKMLFRQPYDCILGDAEHRANHADVNVIELCGALDFFQRDRSSRSGLVLSVPIYSLTAHTERRAEKCRSVLDHAAP